jgi:hypothetical protein
MKSKLRNNKNLKMENSSDNYVETNHDLAEACREFLKKHNDSTVTRVYNPFSDRVIKKSGPTYYNVLTQAKKYLGSLDDEEYHSPIKTLQIIAKPIPPMKNEDKTPEKYLNQLVEDDVILENWVNKIEKKLEKLKEQKSSESGLENRYLSWVYDESIMNYFASDTHFQNRKNEWINRNPELYSFLDYYKPEVFQNTYICKQLIIENYDFDTFKTYLSKTCESFVTKRYDTVYYNSVGSLTASQRYPCSLVMIWIYSSFIAEGRKFMKKKENKEKLDKYIASKPAHMMKIKKQHFSSLIQAFFLMKTTIENIEKAKEDYSTYFDKLLKDFFVLSDKDAIFSRYYYNSILTDFLGNRLRPYRYSNIKMEDLENFDKIVQDLNVRPTENTNDDEE